MSDLQGIISELRGINTALQDELPKAVKEESDFAVEAMRRHFKPYSPNAPTSRDWLQDRRGMLSSSLADSVSTDNNKITAKFFLATGDDDTNIAAWVNEFGMSGIRARYGDNPDILPVPGGKMNIPVGPALDARGVRRYHRVRDAYKDYFILFLDTVIMGRPWNQPNADLEVMWIRAEEVDIPARPFARPEVKLALDRMVQRVEKIMDAVGH